MNIKETYEMFIRSRSVYCSPETLRLYEGHLKVFSGTWKTSVEKTWKT